jgi:hypothetical protein
VALSDTWGNANSFCNNTAINGVSGWRLPTQFDLTELYQSGAMNGQGWTLGAIWSSTGLIGEHTTVNLLNGNVVTVSDGTGAYVTCTR